MGLDSGGRESRLQSIRLAGGVGERQREEGRSMENRDWESS